MIAELQTIPTELKKGGISIDFGYKSAEGTPEVRECGQRSTFADFFMAFIYASK